MEWAHATIFVWASGHLCPAFDLGHRLRCQSATDINMLGARHFVTHVQTVISGVGTRKTRVRASWVGKWEHGKKPALLAGQVSGGAEKGVPVGYRQLDLTLRKPKEVGKHLKGLESSLGRGRRGSSESSWSWQSAAEKLLGELV